MVLPKGVAPPQQFKGLQWLSTARTHKLRLTNHPSHVPNPPGPHYKYKVTKGLNMDDPESGWHFEPWTPGE